MLVRCLYASRPVDPLASTAMETILEQSRRNNARRGITGLLCFTDALFVQVIEGGRDHVCDLLATIVRDERHSHVRLLGYEEIEERRFGNWIMGQVNVATLNPSLLLRYSEHARLDPFAISGNATMRLLLDLVATGGVGRGTA